MKEFLFDANRASFAPRYLLFEMLVKGQPKFGQFSVTHMADPYYKTTHLTLENFGSIARFKSGTISETIERIPTEQIQILNIVDGISTKDPSPLSSVISIADKIYTIDTSFPRYKVKEEAIELLNELYDKIEEYGDEHPTSNYKTFLAYINNKLPEFQKLDSEFTENEAINRKIMRDSINNLKEELKRWIIDLLFYSAQN